MDLPVGDEGLRKGLDRDAFGSGYRVPEPEIIRGLPRSGGQGYTRYTCTPVEVCADGTRGTEFEHLVALADSLLETVAIGLDNLTIVDPAVNRNQESDRDGTAWGPPQNRGDLRPVCWLSNRTTPCPQYPPSGTPYSRCSTWIRAVRCPARAGVEDDTKAAWPAEVDRRRYVQAGEPRQRLKQFRACPLPRHRGTSHPCRLRPRRGLSVPRHRASFSRGASRRLHADGPASARSHVEAKEDQVAVPDYVLLPLGPDEPLVACGYQ